MLESIPYLVAILSFGMVSVLAFLAGQYVLVQSRIQRRLAPHKPSDVAKPQPRAMNAFITKHFDERRFGVDESLRGKLRRELMRAGYFGSDALNYYIFARMAAVAFFPTVSYLAVQVFLSDQAWYLQVGIVLIA